MNYKRGDIYWVTINSAVGREMDKDRPAIIVSCDELNETSPLVSVVYLSTSNQHDLPEHVTIRSTERPSVALCEQIYTVDKSRVGRYVGRLTDDELRRVDIGLVIGLSLDTKPFQAQKSCNADQGGLLLSELTETKKELACANAKLDVMMMVYGRTLEEFTMKRAAG